MAMSAIAPDVTDSNNAYLYFVDGTISNPGSAPTPTAYYPASTQKYSTLADTWTSVKRVPSRRQYNLNSGAVASAYGGAATVGTAIYAISSGATSSPSSYIPYQGMTCASWGCGVNEVYETLTDSWTTRTFMPLGATRGTLVAAQGNRIFAFATNPPAYSGTFTWALRNANKYDATADKWTSCACS